MFCFRIGNSDNDNDNNGNKEKENIYHVSIEF